MSRVCLDVSYAALTKHILSLNVSEKERCVRICEENPLLSRSTKYVKIFVLVEAVYSLRPE